jgi:hypothetical protein
MISRQLSGRNRGITGLILQTNYPLTPTETGPGYEKNQILLQYAYAEI